MSQRVPRLNFFFQAEDGIRDGHVTGVQTCALPICASSPLPAVPTSCRSSNCCERSMRRRMRFESSTIISLKQRWALPFIAFALPLRMPLTLAPSGDRAADRLGGRQQDLEAGEAAGV